MEMQKKSPQLAPHPGKGLFELISPAASRPPRSALADFESRHAVETQNLLNDHQAALRLGVSPATLRSWRCRGVGPPYVKLGHGTYASVRYNPGDLDDFVRQGRHVPSVRAASEE
jgi:hypothetical protein